MPKPTQAQKALQQNPAYIEIIATGNNTSKPGKQSFYVVKEIAKISQVFESAIRKMEENNAHISIAEDPRSVAMLVDWFNHSTALRIVPSNYNLLSAFAHKYKIPKLTQDVETAIQTKIDHNTAEDFDLFVLAVKFNMDPSIIQHLQAAVENDLSAFLASHLERLNSSPNGRIKTVELMKKLDAEFQSYKRSNHLGRAREISLGLHDKPRDRSRDRYDHTEKIKREPRDRARSPR